MDWEVELSGFDDQRVEEYASKYLSDKQKVGELMSKIEHLQTLVQVPILLQMICVLFQSKTSLPDTKCGVISAIVKRAVDRSALRASGTKAQLDITSILEDLGKAAWQSLIGETQQLLMTKVIPNCLCFSLNLMQWTYGHYCYGATISTQIIAVK